MRLRIDGLRIPRRPKSDLGTPGPGFGATDTAADAEAANCSRTDALRRLGTVKAKGVSLDNTASVIIIFRRGFLFSSFVFSVFLN